MVAFETARLRAEELDAGDFAAVLPVHLSNPGYLEPTEGSAVEVGTYDLARLERDSAVARAAPAGTSGPSVSARRARSWASSTGSTGIRTTGRPDPAPHGRDGTGAPGARRRGVRGPG